ncbi:DUF742 domain-containing protein [Sinosporangium siamense]|uniref:DUF742 domain-containing protein n=1 Tax=Sinosporangium siamense TaxID=1367973 RepID=A0A919V7W0_9ACTN|nr:DUF742 domain-containing protein [Sinosporangium siamense]GII93526.1 hypothetical protein Ssi02_37570 [Sinosporangium siamense]
MNERWMDHDAGPIIRPYTMTRGRTRPTGTGLDLISIVTRTPAGNVSWVNGLAPEHLRVLGACSVPSSIAEVASESGFPLRVVQVLLGDLRERGLISIRPPATVAQLPQERLLREVLRGLKAL